MSQNELTGIERQLVLQYLMDGNVPVTVTEEVEAPAVLSENDEKEEKKIKPLLTGVFPVALKAEQMTVLDQGIILLQNPPESVKTFDGKMVRVQFYFNKLGLYFVTKMKSVKSGLALAIPGIIRKVEDTTPKKRGNFTALLYYGKDSKSSEIKCDFLENYPLFVTPKWSDVEEEYQVTAKNYLESFVMHCRSAGQAIGNGLHLITVCRYLSEPSDKQSHSIQNRKTLPQIIYIDEKRIVFAINEESISLKENCEYGVVLGFPIPNGPIKERTIYTDFIVDNLFKDNEEKKVCAVCHYSTIKEEDVRYLEDKVR